jgi:hypothetical protein
MPEPVNVRAVYPDDCRDTSSMRVTRSMDCAVALVGHASHHFMRGFLVEVAAVRRPLCKRSEGRRNG